MYQQNYQQQDMAYGQQQYNGYGGGPNLQTTQQPQNNGNSQNQMNNAYEQLHAIAQMRANPNGSSPTQMIRDLIREQLVGVLGERMNDPQMANQFISNLQNKGSNPNNQNSQGMGGNNAQQDTLTAQLANEALEALFRQEGFGDKGGNPMGTAKSLDQNNSYPEGYDQPRSFSGRKGEGKSKGMGGNKGYDSQNSYGTQSYQNGNDWYGQGGLDKKGGYGRSNSGGASQGNGYNNYGNHGYGNGSKGYGKDSGYGGYGKDSYGGYNQKGDQWGKGYGKGKGGKDDPQSQKKRVRGTEKEAFHRRNLPGSAALEKLRGAINNFSNQNSSQGHGITNDVLGGNIREFSFDPDGVNFLVAALDQPDSRAALRSLFEEEILMTQTDQQVVEMAMDPFASCVLKSLLDLPQFHMSVYNKLRGGMFRLCCNEHGCRVVQKILEVGNDTSGNQMVEELRLNDKHPGGNDVLELVRNPNGNYVISKCLECLPPFNLQWVVDSFRGEVCDMATRRYGSRVLQRIAEYCAPSQSSPVFDEMLVEEDTVLSLMLHPFGNYVMQNIVEHVKEHTILDKVFQLVRQHFLYMSQHKYASNIVEKSIGKMPGDENAGMVMTILKGDSKVNKTNLARGIGVDKNQQNLFNNGVNNKSQIANKDANFAKDENFHLVSLMNDRFGNYVVQKLLETCEDSSFAYRALASKVDEVESHPDLVTSPYAKHILHKLRKGLYTQGGDKHSKHNRNSASSSAAAGNTSNNGSNSGRNSAAGEENKAQGSSSFLPEAKGGASNKETTDDSEGNTPANVEEVN